MKLFIDTNIFVEYFEQRLQFENVKKLLNTLEDRIHTGYISTGSFYTLAYIIDQGFKRKGLNITKCDAIITLNTKDFKDINDSPIPIYTPQEFEITYINKKNNS